LSEKGDPNIFKTHLHRTPRPPQSPEFPLFLFLFLSPLFVNPEAVKHSKHEDTDTGRTRIGED
jgi:hypothetical protein